MNLTKVLCYGNEKADQYLLRMYNQSKGITESFCAKPACADGTKEGLAARTTRALKGMGLELACRAERAAAFAILSISILPQLFFLPIVFAASAVHSIKGNFASRFAQAYFALIYKELCILGELLPSMAAPAFKPTFIPANAFSLMKMVTPLEQYQIATSLAWRSSYARYKQAKLMQSNLGVPQDSYKAREIFKELASKGDAKAHYRLGKNYKYSDIFPQNLEKAFKHLKIASDKGLGKASRMLAADFKYQVFKPSGGNSSQTLYEKGAEQGDRYAQYELALTLAKDSNKGKANKGIRQLEEITTWHTQEAVYAAISLASLYRSGTVWIDPTAPASEAKALYWAKKLLNEDLFLNKRTNEDDRQKINGSIAIAAIYEKKLEKIKIDSKAYEAQWPQMIEDLKKADSYGGACYFLGCIYYEGILVKADVKEAERYLVKALADPYHRKYIEARELLAKIRHPIAAKVPLLNRFI